MLSSKSTFRKGGAKYFEPLFEKVEQNIWLNLTTFKKSRAKYLAQPFLKVDF